MVEGKQSDIPLLLYHNLVYLDGGVYLEVPPAYKLILQEFRHLKRKLFRVRYLGSPQILGIQLEYNSTAQKSIGRQSG